MKDVEGNEMIVTATSTDKSGRIRGRGDKMTTTLAHPTYPTSRNTHHERIIRHIPGYYGTSSYQREPTDSVSTHHRAIGS